RPVDHLMALPILADYIQQKYGAEDIAVVSPDAGRIRVAEQWAKKLGGVNLAFIHKSRDPERPNQAVAKRVIGDVEGKTCILVDDMIDTAGTIVQAADALVANGADSVVIATTHPILSDPATERLRNSSVREVVCTNTLPVPPEKQFDRLTQLSIAPLLARAIRAVFDVGSVTSIFDGEVCNADPLARPLPRKDPGHRNGLLTRRGAGLLGRAAAVPCGAAHLSALGARRSCYSHRVTSARERAPAPP